MRGIENKLTGELQQSYETILSFDYWIGMSFIILYILISSSVMLLLSWNKSSNIRMAMIVSIISTMILVSLYNAITHWLMPYCMWIDDSKQINNIIYFGVKYLIILGWYILLIPGKGPTDNYYYFKDDYNGLLSIYKSYLNYEENLDSWTEYIGELNKNYKEQIS